MATRSVFAGSPSRLGAVLGVVAVAIAALPSVGHATPITVVNTGTAKAPLSGASSLTVNSFALGTDANALAVMVSTGDSNLVSSVTYAGSPISDFVKATQGTQQASIFYLINPVATSGNVVVNFVGVANAAFSVISLTNVKAVNDTATWTGTSAFNGTLAYDGLKGGFMVVSGVDNSSGSSNAPGFSGGNFTTYSQRLSSAGAGAIGTLGVAQGYGAIGSDGAFTTTLTSGGNASSRNAAVLVAFEAVPEPSTVLAGLAAAAGLGVYVRRRSKTAAA